MLYKYNNSHKRKKSPLSKNLFICWITFSYFLLAFFCNMTPSTNKYFFSIAGTNSWGMKHLSQHWERRVSFNSTNHTHASPRQFCNLYIHNYIKLNTFFPCNVTKKCLQSISNNCLFFFEIHKFLFILLLLHFTWFKNTRKIVNNIKRHFYCFI